jgi:DGQHR domain-containing protein
MADSPSIITIVGLETDNLDTVCIRGSAPLADLTRLSQADVFDQVDNPKGLQRDLSRKHAREAYQYAAAKPDRRRPRAWPEVMLNVRDKSVIEQETITEGDGYAVIRVTIDMEKLARKRSVAISRVDGNHRLYFGAGDRRMDPLENAVVPFQLHIGLTPEQETSIFGTTNAEQKGLNTSHLHILETRLLPQGAQMERFPERVYARRLAEDPQSVFYRLVYEGGSKRGLKEAEVKTYISFTALEGAIRRMLTKSSFLQEMRTDPDKVYTLIRDYWRAVKEALPEAFKSPAEYMVMTNMGVNSLAQLGGTVIDQAIVTEEKSWRAMAARLKEAVDVFDWTRGKEVNQGGIAGLSGNTAVLTIADQLREKLPSIKTNGKTVKGTDDVESEAIAA